MPTIVISTLQQSTVKMPLHILHGRAIDGLPGRYAVSETEAFLASVLPRLIDADSALHNGDGSFLVDAKNGVKHAVKGDKSSSSSSAN